jgi:glycosyltransferase involved in cell wall biosynthesis
MGYALADRGYHVHLLTGPDPEINVEHPLFIIEPILATWHPASGGEASLLARKLRRVVRAARLFAAWLTVLRRLRQLSPRMVVWSYWRFALDACFVVACSSLLTQTTLAIVAHEPLPKSDARDTSRPKSGPLLDRAMRAAWRRMGIIFVLGERTANLVRAHWDPSGDIVAIPHGDERALRGVAEVPPVGRTGPVALFFGTLTRYKGLEVLLDAFALVRGRIPQAELIIAGASSADCDLPALLARADAIGNVDIRPSYVPIADVPGVLALARVVVTPYLRATQSGVAHLAYTFARPVVAADVGDIADVVRHATTGLLVPSGDTYALSEALVKLLVDAVMAERLGEAGRQLVEDTHSWEAVAQRIEKALLDAEVRQLSGIGL